MQSTNKHFLTDSKSRLSVNHKVGGSIPGCPSLYAKYKQDTDPEQLSDAFIRLLDIKCLHELM